MVFIFYFFENLCKGPRIHISLGWDYDRLHFFFYPKIMLFRKKNIWNRHPGGSWRALNWDNSIQTECLIICFFCSNNTTDLGWAREMCSRSITRQEFIIYLLECYDNLSTGYMCKSLLYRQSPHSARPFHRQLNHLQLC